MKKKRKPSLNPELAYFDITALAQGNSGKSAVVMNLDALYDVLLQSSIIKCDP